MSCGTCRRCFQFNGENPIMAKTNETADNRSMATDAVATIGMLIPENSGRDAIHLAVEPVVAGERLAPGQHIGFLPDGTVGTKATELLGIVDPFLAAALFPGDRFWLVVYPRTITSLRHVWAHPSFAAAEISTAAVPPKSASEAWMRDWAMDNMSEDYYGDGHTITPESAYENAITAGRDLHIGPYESARDRIDNVWWDHWENITGEKGQRDGYFSCSC